MGLHNYMKFLSGLKNVQVHASDASIKNYAKCAIVLNMFQIINVLTIVQFIIIYQLTDHA